jgi:hypothetical protein
VRPKAANLNIPEGDCCGEAVEAALIPLIAEENSVLRYPRLLGYPRKNRGLAAPACSWWLPG